MGNMRFKVGDRVRIKSIDWYNENKDEDGDVPCNINTLFVASNKKYLGTIQTIEHVYECKGRYANNYIYHMTKIDNVDWTDDMIEGLVEDEIIDLTSIVMETVEEKTIQNALTYGYNLPEGYQFKDENGNVINATKIVLEKKKKEYPKTYEECCKILGLLNVDLCFNADYRSFDASKEQWKRLGLMNQFYQLLICRDAYWKIAGDEMGLGKPWEPDYDSGVNKYGIICMNGVVQESNPTTNWERHLNKIFDFPTEEMRDAFFDNFKELIEQCKELL